MQTNRIDERMSMSKLNENRPGYKKNDVGWIPEEWKYSRLSLIVNGLQAGVSVNSYDEKAQVDELGVLKTSAVTYGHFRPEENKRIIDSEKSRARVSPTAGSIIISRMNTKDLVGASVYIEEDYPNLKLPDRLWQMQVKDKQKHNSRWLGYLMASSRMRSTLSNRATGTSGSMKNISKQDVLLIKIHLPPLPEQKKIAKILSAWDRAIEIANRLITKYELFKKGLMQQLLTGRMRFQKFNHETHENKKGQLPEGWKEVHLKNIAEISFSGVDKKSRPEQKRVRLCNYMNVYCNNYITAGIDFMEATATDAEIEKYSLNVGDIMITKDSETPDDIGVPSVVTERLHNVVCGYHLVLIKPNLEKVDPIFLAKQIGYKRVANQFSRLANGATRFGLTTSSIKSVRLWLPELAEQRCIAAVLFTYDRKIELMEKKQNKLKEQKKGLMQKLLTGEVPVKI